VRQRITLLCEVSATNAQALRQFMQRVLNNMMQLFPAGTEAFSSCLWLNYEYQSQFL
jgi:hypothetical protein